MSEIRCPIPRDAARALFDQIDYRLPINGTCKDGTHSLYIVEDWVAFSPFLRRKDLILAWLAALGGVCDYTAHAVADPNWRDSVNG
jgi:hypothetical protein